MSITSPSITLVEATEIAQYAIDNFPVCADVLWLRIHSRIIKTLWLNRDSKILSVGAWAYNRQFPDSLIQSLPPTNLIICDLNFDRLNSWKIFWCEKFGYEHGSVTPICTDATNLPFWDSSVDLVYSTNLINDPNFTKKIWAVERFLCEWHRTLKSWWKIYLNSFWYLVGSSSGEEYCYNCDTSDIVDPQKLVRLMKDAWFVGITLQKPSKKITLELLEEGKQVRRMKQDGCSNIRLKYSWWIVASKS